MSDRPHPRVALHSPAARHGNLSRFRLLAEVVDGHRRAVDDSGVRLRPRDEALYRKLEELKSSLPIRD